LCAGLQDDAGDDRSILGGRIGVSPALRAVQKYFGEPSISEATDAGHIVDTSVLKRDQLVLPAVRKALTMGHDARPRSSPQFAKTAGARPSP
jgi:hypothetical protein